MREDFLYYLWRYQKFQTAEIKITTGDRLEVIKPGYFNTDSGPDFNEGHIILEGISWFGQVEMHIKSSDWEAHQHQHDPAYNNVILHVVWEHDKEILRPDGSVIPTLELKDIVNEDLLVRYRLLQENLDAVPCKTQCSKVTSLHFLSMVEKCTGERLERKAGEILEGLNENTGDWEETAYKLTMKYLGFRVNAIPMQMLAEAVPFKILKKNTHQPKVLEALLFGQAGLLRNNKDDYSHELQKLHGFYSVKYGLKEPMEAHTWKFMRMRPANFPTLRIAQLVSVICKNPHLFSKYLHENDFLKFKALFKVEPGEYWQTHYHFSSMAEKRNASMGEQAINLLIINVVAPLRAAYAILTDNYSYMDSSIKVLQKIPFEKNKYIKVFEDIPIPKTSGFDSQGLLTLFEEYCNHKRCLNCDVGVALLKAQ